MVCELHVICLPLRNILCEDSDWQVAIRSEIFIVKENKVLSPDNFRSVHIPFVLWL